MFDRASTVQSPRFAVEGSNKKHARLENTRQVLSVVDYPDRGQSSPARAAAPLEC